MNNIINEIRNDFRRNDAVCGRVVGLFQLISNKSRFRIICLLTRGEFCVREIMEAVGGGKLSNISQQLKTLALAGVVERRREEQKVLYRLKDERVRGMIAFLRAQFLEEGRAA